MVGPYTLPPVANLHYSGLGKVPEKDGGWRITYSHLAPLG